jgi:hypothetical protein
MEHCMYQIYLRKQAMVNITLVSKKSIIVANIKKKQEGICPRDGHAFWFSGQFTQRLCC